MWRAAKSARLTRWPSGYSFSNCLAVTVKQHAPFGVFVAIPGVPFAALVKVHEITDGQRMTAASYPPVGAVVDAVVLGFQDKEQEIWFSMKPNRLREAPVAAAAAPGGA